MTRSRFNETLYQDPSPTFSLFARRIPANGPSGLPPPNSFACEPLGLDGHSCLVAAVLPASEIALLKAGVFPQGLSHEALLYYVRISPAKTVIVTPNYP